MKIKNQNKMNWSKRQIQMYGIFLAMLGFLLGISVSHDFHPHFEMKVLIPFILLGVPFSVMIIGFVLIMAKSLYKVFKDI